MRQLTRCLAPALAGMLLCAPALAGEVYKWVDRDGRIHYGDKAQPGWQRVEPKPGTTIPAKPELSPDEAARAQTCARLRRDLDMWRDAPRLVERSPTGEERELTEEQRGKLLERAQEQIRKECEASAAG